MYQRMVLPKEILENESCGHCDSKELQSFQWKTKVFADEDRLHENAGEV